jgi:urease accessory protein
MTRLALAILFVAVSSLSAAAHQGTGVTHDVLAGFLHPLSGLDHLTAMVALGFWAGALGGRALWQWPMAFLLALLLGAMAARGLPHLPIAEWFIIGSAFILSGLAAFRLRLPSRIALPIIAAAAFTHGQAHGSELALDLADFGPLLGFIAATTALHLLGVLLAYLTSRTEVRAFRATS